MDHFVSLGYQVKQLPVSKTIHGSFPFKIAALSYPIGAMKFYPASLRYMGQQKAKYDHMFE